MSATELKKDILELEDATWRALQASGSAMLPFLSRDCVMQFPFGIKLTATSTPSVLEALRSAGFVPWRSFELSQIDITPIGRDGAVISYRARATRPPIEGETQDSEFDALCSSVWRREGSKYAMCFHQQTLTGLSG